MTVCWWDERPLIVLIKWTFIPFINRNCAYPWLILVQHHSLVDFLDSWYVLECKGETCNLIVANWTCNLISVFSTLIFDPQPPPLTSHLFLTVIQNPQFIYYKRLCKIILTSTGLPFHRFYVQRTRSHGRIILCEIWNSETLIKIERTRKER